MSYIYQTKGTCSSKIEVELDGNVVKHVKFTGGCPGNPSRDPEISRGAHRRTGRRKTDRHPLRYEADFLRRPAGTCLVVKHMSKPEIGLLLFY